MSFRSRGRRRALDRRISRQREPGYAEWHEPRSGRCAICGKPGLLLRHHVLYEQHVRREGGDPWDLRNSMDVGRYCTCHADHHAAVRRIPVRLIPQDAQDFIIELLGSARAALYVARYYRTEEDQ